MKVITQAIRVIDYENNRVSARDIMPNFSEYIEQLIAYINSNTSVREYKTNSVNAEVITEVLSIVRNQADADMIKQNVDQIASRLLRKEKEANERISQLDTNVQKGSLILALIEEEENISFLLAKVEHTDLDRKSTRLNSSHVSISYAVFCLKKKSALSSADPAGVDS